MMTQNTVSWKEAVKAANDAKAKSQQNQEKNFIPFEGEQYQIYVYPDDQIPKISDPAKDGKVYEKYVLRVKHDGKDKDWKVFPSMMPVIDAALQRHKDRFITVFRPKGGDMECS